MGFLDKVKFSEEKPVYIKADRLPEGIAFEVIHAAQIPNKSKAGTSSNVVMLHYQNGIQLQFCIDADFQAWSSEEDIKEFDADNKKGNKWYIVSYEMIGNNFVSKLLQAAKIESFKFPIFDSAVHSLKPDKNPEEPSGSGEQNV